MLSPMLSERGNLDDADYEYILKTRLLLIKKGKKLGRTVLRWV